MNETRLSNKPPKGTSDWFPEEFAIRKHIFDIWRKVCLSFGYEEYLTPIAENAEIYRAKSGEDIGGKELMTMFDRAGRELAIRPEMTPSVTRMITRIYGAEPKPIRYFSITNFLRNEKPQRGRNREFWQLNYDIFGSDSINSDIEILQIALEIMLAFKPPEGSFTLFINNRKLIDAVLNQVTDINNEARTAVIRILDKWDKFPENELTKKLTQLNLNSRQINLIQRFMNSKTSETLIKNLPDLSENEGYNETINIIEVLNQLGYENWVKFQPNIIRGFDYYDGMVFEVFDNHPDNSRSLFGGGRYNGLASIFGSKSFPAVGCAPGDETTKLFLESWELLKGQNFRGNKYYLPLLEEKLRMTHLKLADIIRKEGKNLIIGLEVEKLGKSLDYANKRGIDKVIILGDQEMKKGEYQIKDMATGDQSTLKLKL